MVIIIMYGIKKKKKIGHTTIKVKVISYDYVVTQRSKFQWLHNVTLKKASYILHSHNLPLIHLSMSST
jgi:hypothetical protein